MAIGGYLFFNQVTPSQYVNLNTDTPTPTASDKQKLMEVPLLKKIAFPQPTTINIGYTINASYPEVMLVSRPELAAEASDVFKRFAKTIVEDFQKEVADNEGASFAKGSDSELTMQYTPLLLSPTIISMRFDYSIYMSGAAHSDNQSKIINYDLENRTILQATDLFASSTTALSFLSTFTREALKKQLTDVSPQDYASQVFPGTTPTIDNFHDVGISPQGITVIFNPYQVAAYARGTITVQIPPKEKGGDFSTQVSEAIRLATENITEAEPVR